MLLSLVAALSLGFSAHAGGDLYLFGGGSRDAGALKELVVSAGPSARVLIVAWASEVPADTAQGIGSQLTALGAETRISLTPDEPALFQSDLEWASAVFFTGGDQLRLLAGISRVPGLKALLKRRWERGLVLAGTSAGTAALSELVFTGQEDLTRIDPEALALVPGIGILPGVILDQHFLVRSRENRLFSAVLRYPGMLGVGIDENTALVVQGGEGPACVRGPTAVMTVRATASSPSRLEVTLYYAGMCFDVGAARQPNALNL